MPITLGLQGMQALGLPQAGTWERILLVVLHGLGTFAVPTFLFTSGSFASYAAKRTPPRLSWNYVWAAVKRLLWPYLIWSIVAYVYYYFRMGEAYTLWGYFTNLIVGRPFHFIPILLFYYLCSPLLVRVSDRFGYLLLLGILLYQALLVSVLYPITFGFSLPDWAGFLVPPVLGNTMTLWAIFFPMGLVYSLKARQILPWLQKYSVIFLVATVGLFVLQILSTMEILNFSIASFLAPITFLLLVPTIRRGSIPMVRRFEKVAKKSYGLYLMQLIVLDVLVLSSQILVPSLLAYPLLFCLILFVLALAIPVGVMGSVVHTPARGIYRYLFG